jgi:2-keto-4-pentenoate hydratase/2-oxohepta-3-ene-1,7-dioic acid hydratase in catechol pathway
MTRDFRAEPEIPSEARRMLGLPEMRLVTYDRRGHRRLGAILDGRVVDLPDAVGHPAFPTTLEAFVQSSRGTVLDAARAALARDDVRDHVVKQARVLPPLFPRSLLLPAGLESRAEHGEGSEGLERRIAGPEQDIGWPAGAAWLDYEPKVAAVLAVATKDVETDAVAERIFGYTLVSDWVAKDASGDPVGTSEGVPISIGPCVVTVDECDPQAMFLQAKVDGGELAKGNLNGSARSLFGLIAAASRGTALERGDAFALGPFPARDDDPNRRLWPGALVELAAEGIGTLRNRLGARP